MDLPDMLALTITGTINSTSSPEISIGQGPGKAVYGPSKPLNNSYWFCVLDAQTPTKKIIDFIVPGSANTVVPDGLEQYMKTPGYIITLVTQNLAAMSVPQGAFYDFLTQHGAGRELNRLEQLNTTLGCGQIGGVSYVLVTQSGASFGYEEGSENHRVRYVMSLKMGDSGYTLCDAYTFRT